jgi:hypothetical protein
MNDLEFRKLKLCWNAWLERFERNKSDKTSCSELAHDAAIMVKLMNNLSTVHIPTVARQCDFETPTTLDPVSHGLNNLYRLYKLAEPDGDTSTFLSFLKDELRM